MHGNFRAIAVSSTSTRAPKAKTLAPLHPNLGLSLAYRKKLDRLIAEMNASVDYWIKAAYRENPPTMAMDDVLPANSLSKAVQLLKKRWLKRFDWAAPKLAEYFSTAVHKRTDKALAQILRKGGFAIKFQQSQAMKDVVEATTHENVALIKSIAQQHLNEVEGLVMRSVSRGRDLGYLSKELQKRYGVTKRRAALISKDQNNKATSAMTQVRQIELGVTRAKWRHSGGGKHPRPTHVAMNNKTYDIVKGMWDPAINEWTWPGVQINCRCVSISLIPGFT